MKTASLGGQAAAASKASAEPDLPPEYIRAPPEQLNREPENVDDRLFGPGRGELLRVIKKVFPKDPQTQALKD